MPFEKGRAKTGGRQKGGKTQRTTRFVDQLKNHGFNYVKELADCLKEKEFKLSSKYLELKSLLPYMAPRLREKDVEIGDNDGPSTLNTSAISDADLLKAMDNGKQTPAKPRSNSRAVEARNPVVEVSGRPEADLSDVAREQSPD